MKIKNYRSFTRENKRIVNKLTIDNKLDLFFEEKVNLYLNNQISKNDFDYYLESELFLNINESNLITESLASKFADSVKSKIKSVFNNLYNKLKETRGFEMIISFFNKVVSGFSKFWKFLKKIKAGKILKKLLITLGITSLVSYILAQFGAGWVALMGGRMAASTLGRKVSDKVVKENLNYLMLFEEFNTEDSIKKLNTFLSKINVSTNKLNSDLIINFYKKVIDPSKINNFDKWENSLVEILKLLKNTTNSRNESRIKESLDKLKKHLLIDEQGNSKLISDKNLKSYLSKSDGRKWGDLHGEILSILSSYSLTKGGEKTEQKPKQKPNQEKDVQSKENTDSGEEGIESEYKEDSTDKDKDKKKSIWSKIGSSISKFFKILRKLKWAIVIFFGVVFILNLIFFPIFEPILQVAQASSFTVILSDTFEETANVVESIPKISTDDIDLNLDITSDLPSDSVVTKNLQEAIDDIKDNISDNPEEATNEVTDLVNNMKSDVLNDTEDIESIKDPSQEVEGKSDVDPSQEVEGIIMEDEFIVQRSKQSSAVRSLLNKIGDQKGVSGGFQDANQYYDIQVYYDSDEKIYTAIALKRDSIGGEVSDEKWNQVLGKSDVDPSQEVEEKGGFLKKLKDKIKGILPDDIDKVTKSIDKQGFEGISTNKISSGINKALESGKLDASDLDKLKNINGDDFYTFTSSSSSAARTALIEKLPSGYDSNLLVSKEIGGKTTWAYLLPKDNLEGAEEVVKEAGDKLNDYWNALNSDSKSKIKEIADNLRENSEPRPGSETFEYTLVKSLESGKLSISDLDKIEKLNTGDFYTSSSPIKQNAMIALNDKLSQAGVKVDDNSIIIKELDNGNYRAYYLIPK